MEREFTDSYISRPVEFPLGREGDRQRMQHVLISANKGVVSLFPPLLSLSAPGGERCWLFALPLSCGRQDGLLGNLSGQVEEWSTASIVTVFPPLVFTFYSFCRKRIASLPSSSPLVLPTTLSFVFVFLLCFLTSSASQVCFCFIYALEHFLLS